MANKNFPNHKIIAVIPARMGSKRIPKKYHRFFGKTNDSMDN